MSNPNLPPAPDSLDVNPLRKLWWTLGAVGVLIFALWLFLPRSTGPAEKKEQVSSSTWDDGRCDRVLGETFRGLAPDRLGISSNEDSIVRDLNQWTENCGVKNKVPFSEVGLADWVAPAELKEVESDRFSRRDAAHIRMCRLAREIVQQETGGVSSDRERAIKLFEFITREVEPFVAAASNPPPFTPFECLLFGEGGPADRVWLFTELLRQIPLDAVVFLHDDAGGNEHPLVGVLTADEGCLLFDPVLGLPIPANLQKDDAPLFSKPVDWKTAAGDDEIFRQLDIGDDKTPWTAEKLKAAKVGLVGTSAWWSARMANLQFQLQPISHLTISEPLVDPVQGQKGYAARVLAYNSTVWTRDRVSVWDYPDRQLDRAGTVAEHPYASAIRRVFNGPTIFQVSSSGEVRQEAQTLSKRPLKLVRIGHLQGKEDTLVNYLAIRNAPSDIPSDENRAAAQFANFWSGVYQLEQGKTRAGRDTLVNYLKTQIPALRGSAAVRLIAESQAMEKDRQAIATLESLEKSPEPHRRAILLRHWKRVLPE